MDKRCSFCDRTYRGMGYGGHCTSQCYAIKKHKESFPYAVSGISELIRNDKRDYLENENAIARENTIKNANAKWLKTEYVPPEKRPRKDDSRIKWGATTNRSPSWTRKFQGMRG